MNQAEAKEFFAQWVIRQAESEREPLSRAEQFMLYWTETGPGFDMEGPQFQELLDEYNSETNDEDFEEKVRGLLQRAFEGDMERGEPTLAAFQEAYRVLSEGDHYILVMIDSTIGGKLRKKRWWFF